MLTYDENNNNEKKKTKKAFEYQVLPVLVRITR